MNLPKLEYEKIPKPPKLFDGMRDEPQYPSLDIHHAIPMSYSREAYSSIYDKDLVSDTVLHLLDVGNGCIEVTIKQRMKRMQSLIQ